MTYAAKIEGTSVKIVEIRTNSTKRTFGCASYKGAKSVNITGDLAAVTCGDGKVRVYDIRTGFAQTYAVVQPTISPASPCRQR